MLFSQGEQFELSPATPLLSQAVVLGDRRTFSVYDLTQQATFGATRSLNLLIRWKTSEGEWEEKSQKCDASRRVEEHVSVCGCYISLCQFEQLRVLACLCNNKIKGGAGAKKTHTHTHRPLTSVLLKKLSLSDSEIGHYHGNDINNRHTRYRPCYHTNEQIPNRLNQDPSFCHKDFVGKGGRAGF